MTETDLTSTIPEELQAKQLTLPDAELPALDSLATWSHRLGIFLIVLGVLYVLTIFVYAIPTVVAGVFFIAMGTRLTAAARDLREALEQRDGEALGSAFRFMKTFFVQNLVFYSLVIVFMILMVVAMLVFAPAFQELLEGAGGFSG